MTKRILRWVRFSLLAAHDDPPRTRQPGQHRRRARQRARRRGGGGDPWSVSTGTDYASDTFGGHVKSITAGAVTIVSPVATDGTSITLIRGDDYLNADNRALTFSGDSWPTLTSGAVALIVDEDGTPTSYAGTITGAQSCYVELTDTQTVAMWIGLYDYDLQATLSNGSVVTLVQGLLLVQADVR